MNAAKKTEASAVETPWENPLIPNKRLRQIYTAMAELRLLEEHLATRQRRKAAKPSREEAVRASTALSLLPGDITSDIGPGVATRFLRGTKLANILMSASDSSIQPKSTELPFALDSERRVLLAIGAALALAPQKNPLVLAYIEPGELAPADWKPLFRLVATHAAPIIFVALPSADAKPGKLCDLSTTAGVPGIPVDAADAVGLYRVIQESILRARAGGGPVLMECIPFQLPGTNTTPADPVLNMRESLLHRKIADDAWFHSVATRFIARLSSASSSVV